MADDLRREVQRLPKFGFLVADDVFRPPPLFLDVREYAIPLHDLATVVPQRDTTLQMPTVLAVRATEPHFVFQRLAAGRAREPLRDVSLKIGRVRRCVPTPSEKNLFGRHSAILDEPSVCVGIRAVWQGAPDNRGHRCRRRRAARRPGPGSSLRSSMSMSMPIQWTYRAVLSPKGLCAAQEPSVAAFDIANPETHLARAACSQAFRPDPPRRLLIPRMEQGDMRIPRCGGVRAMPKRMVAREPKEVRSPFVDQGEGTGREGVPGDTPESCSAWPAAEPRWGDPLRPVPADLSRISPLAKYRHVTSGAVALDSRCYAWTGNCRRYSHQDRCWIHIGGRVVQESHSCPSSK